MKKNEMQEQRILDYLYENKKINITDASKLFGISESTVRRLFIKLESNGKVLRSHGGITLYPDNFLDYSYEKSMEKFTEQKKKIALKAVSLVENEDILFLDSGTTIAQFSGFLARAIEDGKIKNITIFTNSLINLNNLHKYANVSIIGGKYRDHRKDFCGYISEEIMKTLFFTKCFLGADGYSTESGFTSKEFNTARINEYALSNSKKRYILLDSSKFSSTAVVSYSKNFRIDAMITDTIADENIIKKLGEQNTRIIITD